MTLPLPRTPSAWLGLIGGVVIVNLAFAIFVLTVVTGGQLP